MCIRNLLATVLLTTIFTVSAVAQCSDAEKAALEQFDKTWSEHTQKGNRAELERIYADDYADFGPMAITVRKQDAVDAAVRAAANPNPNQANINSDNYVITCTPNTAVITHRNVNKVMMNGKENTRYSRSVHILEKRGGRWQVVSDVGHPMPGGMFTAWNTDMDAIQAFRQRDVDWFERHTVPDFVSIGPDGQVGGKAQLLEYIKNPKAKIGMVQVSDVSLRGQDDTVVITGIDHIKGQSPDGKPIDNKHRFTRTYVKKDDTWQLLSSHSTLLNDK